MDFIDAIPESLLKERLINLGALYEGIDREIHDFAAAVGFSCSFGCGKCCQGFMPDVLPLEAAYIASFLISKKRELVESSSLTCPLYLENSPFHCSGYEARPLVCRMFGFSGTLNKYNDLSFSLCRFIEGSSLLNNEKKFTMLQHDPRFPLKPPVMSHFGEKLQALDPDSSGVRQLLYSAVPAAIDRILFLMSIHQAELASEPGTLQ